MWKITLQRFLKYRSGLLSLLIFFIICFGVILGPYLCQYDPHSINAVNSFEPPSKSHIFGTDDMGRDVFVRILFGGRSSLMIGIIATCISLIVGMIVGLLAGQFGGYLDKFLMRITDFFLGLPSLFIILLLGMLMRENKMSFLRTGILPISFVIGCLTWMELARLVRASFLFLREKEFILATRALGASEFRIISHHIIPNTLEIVIVNATLTISGSILMESGLSYLGFGVQPPTPTWGNMLNRAQTYFYTSPWLGIFPGLIICLTVSTINFIGDRLSDSLDPHNRNNRRIQ